MAERGLREYAGGPPLRDVGLTEHYRPFADLVHERLLVARWATADKAQRGRLPLPDTETAKRRWNDAVTAQATLSRQGEAVARRVVVSMLNQMLRLARVVPWWESHAEAAIAETVEYASGNLAVASGPAQRAWDAYWAAHDSVGCLLRRTGNELGLEEGRELQALGDRMSEAEAEWRAEWDLWLTGR